MKLQEIKKHYVEGRKILAILGDFDRNDKIRTKLLNMTTIATLNSIEGFVKTAEDMGINLMIERI